ncbi:MAG: FliM/FliN family flagellar motor switch protein [Acidobacteriota bacterium]
MDKESTKTDAEQKSSVAPGSEDDSWESVSGLPCHLSVALPVAGFRVRDLLELEIKTVVDTRCNTNNSVPVWVNAVRIGEAEFDVFGTRLAIRIDELG